MPDDDKGRRMNIKVTIEGIELPLTVNAEDEKTYRDAASLIAQRLRGLRDRFPNLPNDKYYYAMVMLNTAVDAVRATNSASTAPYVETITDLDAEMDAVLAKHAK